MLFLSMKKAHAFSLPIIISREGKHYVAYCPALDLSTVGKTEADAKRMFHEAAELFFEELVAMGTLDKALSDLGWQKDKKTHRPPAIIRRATMRVKTPAR